MTTYTCKYIHAPIYVQIYTCANGLDVGNAYVQSIGTCIYSYVYVIMRFGINKYMFPFRYYILLNHLVISIQLFFSYIFILLPYCLFLYHLLQILLLVFCVYYLFVYLLTVLRDVSNDLLSFKS